MIGLVVLGTVDKLDREPMGGTKAIQLEPFGIGPWWWVLGAVTFVAVLMAVWKFVDWREARSPAINEGECTGVVGKPGAGKTLFAVRLASAKLAAGAKVCTNFTLELPPDQAARWTPFYDWTDLVRLQDAVIILDEAHIYASSADKLSRSAAWWISQVRRMGCQFVWVSQNEMRVSKTLRDLTNYIWVCNRSRSLITRKLRFQARLYEPETVRVEGKHLQVRRWRQDDDLFNLFDSWEILAPRADDSPEGRLIRELALDRNSRRRAERDVLESGRETALAPASPAPSTEPTGDRTTDLDENGAPEWFVVRASAEDEDQAAML